ncbi:MAG TPA: MarR family transcriptional regulator [Casimicrobiaceae bacterium]|nr:MarR family transcriptional regulator [Casimicrobiaceae bacterium]
MTKRTPRAGFYVPGNYAPEESVGLLMKRVLASIVGRAEARLKPHGVTHAQWHPLFRLREAGRPKAVVALARELRMDTGAMTRLIDRLERKRLCRRVRSTEDRRIVMVELTPSGAEAAAIVPAVLSDVMNAHFAGFSRAEWESLVQALRRMLDNADALQSGSSTDPE